MNDAAKDIYVQGFVWMYVFMSLGELPRNGFAGSYGKFIFNFLKHLPDCFPEWLHPFTFSNPILQLLIWEAMALAETSRFYTCQTQDLKVDPLSLKADQLPMLLKTRWSRHLLNFVFPRKREPLTWGSDMCRFGPYEPAWCSCCPQALCIGSPWLGSSSLAETSSRNCMGPACFEKIEHLLTCQGFCSLRIWRVFFMEILFKLKSFSNSSIA